MSCKFPVEWLHRKIDGELTPEESGRLDAHLDACGECREHIAELSSVGDLLREASLLEPAASPTSVKEPTAAPRITRLGLPAAAALLFAACLFIMNLPQPAPVDRDREVTEAAEFEVVETADDVLAVNVPSKNPNVHIVWLYSLDPEKGRSR